MRHHSLREALNSGETLVFGHRGAMAQAPMNTLAAFELAFAQGADGIELDIQLSRDGHLVVIHDYTVDATTDGQGSVADMTLEELKQLDAGSWYADRFAGQRIPTLGEVFAAFGDSLLVNVEIKPISDQSGAVETAVANHIRRFQMQSRTIVSSFDPQSLRRFHEVCPEVMTGFLYMTGLVDDIDALIAELSHEARHPWHEQIDENYMNWARAQGYYINVWTVNDVERALQLQTLGVNAIITDEPGRIISALKQC